MIMDKILITLAVVSTTGMITCLILALRNLLLARKAISALDEFEEFSKWRKTKICLVLTTVFLAVNSIASFTLMYRSFPY